MPASVYWEAAQQRKLLVAVNTKHSPVACTGHLLYGGVFPHARIFQLFVQPDFRGHGIARLLVEELVNKAEEACFLSVIARVATDLPANDAWEKLGFQIITTIRGGDRSGRYINVRARELNTPSLFRQLDTAVPQPTADFRLVERLSVRAPQYVIDLNVFWDAVRNTAQAPDARRLIGAGLGNLVRLSIAEEFVRELQRTSTNTNDPVLRFARELPQLPQPDSSVLTALVTRLAPIVFPDRHAQKCLTTQDRSDLIHLATAIHHSASGFVTSEKSILRARDKLQMYYAIDVVGPVELAALLETPESSDAPITTISTGVQYTIANLEDIRAGDVRAFLTRLGVPAHTIADVLPLGLGSGRRRVIGLAGETIIAYVSWDPLSRPTVEMFAAADESARGVDNVVDHLLSRVAEECRAHHPLLIKLSLPIGQVTARHAAFAHGYRPVLGSDKLHKISIGRVIDGASWGSIRLQLNNLVGVSLPDTIPEFKDPRQLVLINTPTGTHGAVTLKDLETLLGPTLILFPGRDGVVISIERRFADELLGTSNQLSLLPPPEAVLLSERAYFSRRQNARLLVDATPILFYESKSSGGRGSVVAAGRVVRTEILRKAELVDTLKRRGVLTDEALQQLGSDETITATTFDNILRFRSPVTLAQLNELGYVDPTNMITARRIQSALLCTVIAKGQ